MRKDIFILSLIIAISAISLFGALGLGMVDHKGSHYCPISSLSLGRCTPRADTLAFVQHHISGTELAIQAIFERHAFAFMFALLSLVIFAFLRDTVVRNSKIVAAQNIFYKRNLFTPVFHAQFLLRRWLALHTRHDPSQNNIWALLPVFV